MSVSKESLDVNLQNVNNYLDTAIEQSLRAAICLTAMLLATYVFSSSYFKVHHHPTLSLRRLHPSYHHRVYHSNPWAAP